MHHIGQWHQRTIKARTVHHAVQKWSVNNDRHNKHFIGMGDLYGQSRLLQLCGKAADMRSFIDDIDDHLRSVRTGGCHDEDYNRGYDDGLDYAIAALEILTVRCNECKHKTYCYSNVFMTNKTQSKSIYKDIDFCSFAERRQDGENKT